MEMQMIPKHMRQQRASPNPHSLPRESPMPRQYTQSPAVRTQSPLVGHGGYIDNNRQQETPISQLQSRALRQTPIDELNRYISADASVVFVLSTSLSIFDIMILGMLIHPMKRAILISHIHVQCI